MKKKPFISITDIAAKAGVSIGTVDRVLHHRGEVSSRTEAKVQSIVAKLGYRPNIYARNLSLAKIFHFGVLMPLLSQDSGYWRIPVNGIGKAQRELDAYKVRIRFYHFDRYSESSLKNAWQRVLRDKLDGLLVAPVLPSVAQYLLPKNDHGMPVVFFDCEIPGSRCLTSICQDPDQSGMLAAHLITMMIKTQGTVAVIKVVPEDYHINKRIRGFQDGINGRQNIQIKVYEVDSHNGEKGFRNLAKRIIRENRDLRGIFVSNAWTYPFAECVKDLSGKRRISIVGYDLVTKNIKYLEEGGIDFIISQRPEMQGYEGIYALYRHVVLRDRVKSRITVPLDILTKENIRYYQN